MGTSTQFSSADIYLIPQRRGEPASVEKQNKESGSSQENS